MALATGAGSKVIYSQYTSASMATAPSTNYKNLPFSTETLTETINEVRSTDITAARAATGIRGGNIAAGGSVTCDLGIKRHAEFWKHLLGHDTGSTAYTGTYTGVAALTTNQAYPSVFQYKALANTTAYVRGQYVTDSYNISTGSGEYTGTKQRMFVCTKGGTTTAADITSVTGEQNIGAYFKYVGPAKITRLKATNYVVGDIVYSALIVAPYTARYYICRSAGTVTAAEVTTGLTGTTRNTLSATVWDYIQDVECQTLANYSAEPAATFATGHLLTGIDGLYVCTTKGSGALTITPENLTGDNPGAISTDWIFKRCYQSTNIVSSTTVEVGAVVSTNPLKGAGTIANFGSDATVRGGSYICAAKGSSETVAGTALTDDSITTAGGHIFVRLTKSISALTENRPYEVGELVIGLGPSSVNGIYQCVDAGTTEAAAAGWTQLTGVTDTEAIAGTGSNELAFKYIGPAEGLIIWEHIMYPGQTLPTKGLMFEKQVTGGDESLYVTFEKSRVNTVEVTLPQEGIVTGTWTISCYSSNNGRTGTASITSATIGEISDTTLAGYECFIKFGAASNPQAVRPIRNASFSISNQIDESTFIVGDRYRQGLPENQRAVSGRFTTYFQDRTEYNVFKNETTTTLDFHIVSLDGEQLIVSMGECKMTGTGLPQVSGSGVMSADFTFGAMKQYGNTDVYVTIRSFLPSFFYFTA